MNIMLLDIDRQPVWKSLARYFANAKPGDEKQEAANRLFARMTPEAQLLCRMELLACQRAKRGELLADIEDAYHE